MVLLCGNTILLPSVLGQHTIIENIGFGQPEDSSKEGESETVRIRLEPDGISQVVMGQIIPLSLSQYEEYTFTTERTVPLSVLDAISDIQDSAECEFFTLHITFNSVALYYLQMMIPRKILTIRL
jgi:hypothetical protein